MKTKVFLFMNECLIEVLNILNNQEFEAYVVGGYVRDYLLNIKSTDFDICTNAMPCDLERLFECHIISKSYGSFKIKYHNYYFEITSYRCDISYNNHRFPEIEYTSDLYTDLQRRDFTINTICMDKNEKIVDLLNGIEDLNNKLIKTVGDSDKKINEDALRILRAIRFATILNFKLDDELINSIKRYKYLLTNLSYTRKKEELDKIFKSSNVNYGIKLLKNLGLDKYLDINIDNIIITDYMGIWYQVKNNNYPFNKKEKYILNNIDKVMNLDILDNINLYYNDLDICLIVADIKGIGRNIVNKLYNELPIKNRYDINISNKDLMHIVDNNKISLVINDIENKIIKKKFNNDYESILNYVKETYL